MPSTKETRRRRPIIQRSKPRGNTYLFVHQPRVMDREVTWRQRDLVTASEPISDQVQLLINTCHSVSAFTSKVKPNMTTAQVRRELEQINKHASKNHHKLLLEAIDVSLRLRQLTGSFVGVANNWILAFERKRRAAGSKVYLYTIQRDTRINPMKP